MRGSAQVGFANTFVSDYTQPRPPNPLQPPAPPGQSRDLAEAQPARTQAALGAHPLWLKGEGEASSCLPGSPSHPGEAGKPWCFYCHPHRCQAPASRAGRRLRSLMKHGGDKIGPVRKAFRGCCQTATTQQYPGVSVRPATAASPPPPWPTPDTPKITPVVVSLSFADQAELGINTFFLEICARRTP